MDTRSTSRDAESFATGLSDIASGLTSAELARIGGGAALALVGSGLLSLGTIVRLAAVLGGGAVVWQTLKAASAEPGRPAPRTESTWGARAAWQETSPAHDADADGATMEGSDPAPASRSRAT
ncbi:hypothetical protein [Piscinibacter gummiphilus]|uniref:Uncharacterized protein n=1 Tax=Piscinibacter gummiphilus TaxID=946333 RepID=A0A1W6L747_9BURK|nr:hypothetical protein [Piscinibacter gummiphilus]ARN20171.1 hypothetical protein A4W93_09760 [Piscinibacter gummiphilus]ATU64842.1 hypothetical protein CPZ87_09835 [Piscinibacter gummiphilus]GLS96541.1 hypothetical protein GCM10007918_38330 [Piscinibacter gummiphilus]